MGDLRATVGADLEYLGDTAAITTFEAVDLNGLLARVMGFGSNSINQGFWACHGIPPNGGGQFANQYTVIMDVMYPARSSSQWRALLQTDPFNHDATGAEFFVGDDLALPDPNGIGTEGEGHVFELAGSRIPLPSLSQNPRQAPAAPKRIGLNERPNLCDVDATDFAALDNLGFEHEARLPSGFGGVPYKMKLFWSRFPRRCSPGPI